MFQFCEQRFSSGIRLAPIRGNNHLSFRDLFLLLATDAEFAFQFSDVLANSSFEGFFLEFPPLTTATFADEAEFVIIESSAVANLRAEPAPFESQFSRQEESDVIMFSNLGGDALLIVPKQRGPIENYPHLGAFLRKAPREQRQMLWQVVARAVQENLSDTPMWVSTAGLGVSWLHIRLDSRPKYYNHVPYKSVKRSCEADGS